MWTYNYNDELYHYGVQGMKWGHRKKYLTADGSELNDLGKARKNYEDAKRSRKEAEKGLRISKSGLGFGYKGIRRKQEALDSYNDAELNEIDAKAKYNSAKAKNSKKAERAEFNTYRKAFSEYGLPDSAYDKETGGQGKRLYEKIKSQKGEQYADSILKSYQNRNVAGLAVGTAVSAGSLIALSILSKR